MSKKKKKNKGYNQNEQNPAPVLELPGQKYEDNSNGHA